MVQRTLITLEDDIDGGPADETIEFRLDGVAYAIDLSTDHADELRQSFDPWVTKARRTTTAARGSRNGSPPSSSTRNDPSQLRAQRTWAQQQGYPVSDRGRIPAHVVAAYETAHNKLTSH